MSDAYTVLRKELLEVFSDRHAFRGPLFQAAIVLSLTGLLLPALDRSIWTPGAMMMLYAVFPSTLAAAFTAEGFAGEKERRTLETLLATPLDTGAIFLGKTAVAVLFVVAVSAAALLGGLAVAELRGLLPALQIAQVVPGILGGALSGALLTAAIGMAISVRVAVARSAQQMASILILLVAGGAGSLLRFVGGELDWTLLLQAEAVVLLIAALALGLAIRLFRREFFFERQ
jgi:ABC-2 type transport system permease protein